MKKHLKPCGKSKGFGGIKLMIVQVVMTQCELWADNTMSEINIVNFPRSVIYDVRPEKTMMVAQDTSEYNTDKE
ncbi:hypothetical protein [Paratissierella segnis]|nr:hypothetical protein [Paratissierella segnis]